MINITRFWADRNASAQSYRSKFVFILGAVAVAMLLSAETALTSEQAVLAALILFVGIAPAILYLRSPRAKYPLVELTLFFHAVTYGLVSFSPQLIWRDVPVESVTSALGIALSGICMLWAGSRIGWCYRQQHDRFQQWDTGNPLKLPLLLEGINLLGHVFPEMRSLPTLPHILETGGWIGIVMLYLAGLRGRLAGVERLLFFLMLIAEAMYRLASGSLANLMILLIVIALVHWREKARIPKMALVVSLAIMALLNPVKGAWRQEIWTSDSALSAPDKILRLSDLTVQYYTSPETTIRDTVETNVNRIGNIQTLAWVRYVCPEFVQYWEGESFKSLVYSFVPRFLFPEKPQGTFGNQFGRRYLLLGLDDYITSFNLPWITDFYVNFGATGVMVGMLAAGILLGVVANMYGGRSSDIHFAIGVAASHQLFFAESNFALMWGNVLLDIVAFTLLFTFLLKRKTLIVSR